MLRTLLLAIALSGCFLDPTCKDVCDGDRIVSCKWNCSGQGKIDIPECQRNYGGTNCAERTGLSGRPMSCRMGIMLTRNSPPSGSPACVDLGSPCDPSSQASCTGPNSAAACVRVEDGGFLQPLLDPVCQDRPNEACHDRPFGVMCVPLPKRACDPALFPACNADGGYDTCQGTADAGYVILPSECGERPCTSVDSGVPCGPLRCTGDAGAAFCQ